MTHPVLLKFQNLCISVHSKDEEFAEFLEHFFSDILIADLSQDPQIEVSYEKLGSGEFDQKLPTLIDTNTAQYLSRQIIHSGNRLLIKEVNQFPGLKLMFEISEKKIKLEAYFEQQQSWKEKLRGLFFPKQLNLKLFLYLKYYLLLFPAIWYQEHFLNRYLLHASAITSAEKSVLFSGLGGVGKSTLTLAFLNQPGLNFISDNLLQIDFEGIYTVHEAIALDDRSVKLIGAMAAKLKTLDLPISHGRQYFQVKQKIASGPRPQCIFFITQGSPYKLEPISATRAFNKLLAVDKIAREVVAYNDLAATLNLMQNSAQPAKKIDHLKRHLEQMDCFLLSLEPGQDLQKPVQDVLEIMKTERPSNA